MITVERHNIAAAIDFKTLWAATVWAVYGGTSPWADENNPPEPIRTVLDVATPIAAQKGTVRWVQPDPAGAFVFNTQDGVSRWTEIVLSADVIIAGAHWCLLRAVVPDTLPLTTFRQYGFYTGLVAAGGHSGDTGLTPANVVSYGLLRSIEYVIPQARVSGSSTILSSIIEF